MLETFQKLFSFSLKRRQRRFLLTITSLESYANLSKGARELLNKILQRLEHHDCIDAVIVSGTYSDFGYDNRSLFYRHRKELIETQFIVSEGKDHMVNPLMIEYNNRRQKSFLVKYFNLKKEPPSFSNK